jgi:hypothetical protein
MSNHNKELIVKLRSCAAEIFWKGRNKNYAENMRDAAHALKTADELIVLLKSEISALRQDHQEAAFDLGISNELIASLNKLIDDHKQNVEPPPVV